MRGRYVEICYLFYDDYCVYCRFGARCYIQRFDLRALHRNDDPHRVKQVILDVLAKIKAVVDNPAVEVFMQEIDDALIKMEVRYYVILSPQQARAKVRSEVLFALWDAFKANDIHPSYQQFDIRLDDRHHERTVK